MKKSYIKKSFIFFKNVKSKILILTLFYISLGLINFIYPILEANLISSLTDIDTNRVIYIALLLFLIVFFDSFFYYIIEILWRKKVRNNILYNIRKYLLDNVLELRLSNFDKYQTGTFQERVKYDPATIARVVNAGQRNLIELISKVSVIFYVFYLNFIIGIIYLIGLIIVALVDNYYQKNRKAKDKKLRESDEKLNSLLSEVIRGIRDIKLLNFKNNIKRIMINKLDETNNYAIDKDNYDSKYREIENNIMNIIVFIIIIVGIKFIDLKLLTPTNLIAIYLYNSSIFSLLYSYRELRTSLKEYELAVERLFDLEDNKKYPKDKFGNIHIKNFQGKIEFDNVTFGYNDKNKVLNGLTFTINPKDTVALVGSSGAGKTTIFNLLTKSYLINSGAIKLDDININDLDEETLRKNVSIITQNPYIFNMSIKDNLLLVKPKATKKELDRVCKEACFYDFIMSLPDKYDTIIGEGGVNLSGGQRQRLAIARALLKDCKILLFDEATSALDNITQKEIQESIDHISDDYTIVVIAHRLSTIINCNPIYILKDGQIIDSGSHKQLLRKNKDYKSLYKSEK